MILIHSGAVVAVDMLGQNYVLLSVWVESIPRFSPGQFMMVRLSEGYDPLLLRPFSILDAHEGVYRFLIKVVGKGTRAVRGFRYGRKVLLTGPFGNGFPGAARHGTIIVAGGAGIASVFSLVQRLHERGIAYELLYGARTEAELVLSDLLRPYDPIISTDDGSRGHYGRLTDVLAKRIKGKKAVFACGPLPMLAAVADLSLRHTIECYVSIEARMACGFGVCLGCTIIDGAGNTRRVCRDGPVFNARDIVLPGVC